METSSKQTYWSMNRMIVLIIQYLLCVLPMGKIWHFSGKFDQDLPMYCGSVKPKFYGLGDRFSVLVRVLWVMISKIYCQFCQSFFKNTFESSYNLLSHWNNVEKNGTFSLFETIVNGNVTFSYIMTFHCTSVYLYIHTKTKYLNFL